MTLHLHLQIVGALLLSLGMSHSLFSRYFGWGRELAGLSVLTRRIFHVHSFFIALLLGLLGICSLLYTDALLEPTRLSRAILAGQVVFWFCRLLVQLFIYDKSIWQGRPFYKLMHIAFTLFWIYVTGAYSAALCRCW